jgi:hypothetical protein
MNDSSGPVSFRLDSIKINQLCMAASCTLGPLLSSRFCFDGFTNQLVLGFSHQKGRVEGYILSSPGPFSSCHKNSFLVIKQQLGLQNYE